MSWIGSTAIGVTGSRTSAGTPRGSSSSPTASRRIAPGCGRCRRRAFDFSLSRVVRVPTDGYLRHGGVLLPSPDRAGASARGAARLAAIEVWVCWRGQEVVRYPRSYRPGVWIPEPRMRPEPPPPPMPALITAARIEAPELADYAELCA